MFNKKNLSVVLISLFVLMGCQATGSQLANTGPVIDREVDAALANLYATTPEARNLAMRAKGVLVFPDIVKAGFIFGGQYGRGGALRINGRTAGYYNSTAASYGLQAGVQSFGYVLFLMDSSAINYLNRSGGWEVGVGPSIVVVDAGIAKTLTTTTGKDNIYAFIFDQKGIMAGLGVKGSKITRIYPD